MRGELQENKVAGSSPAPLARQRVVQLDRTWRVSRYLVGAALLPLRRSAGQSNAEGITASDARGRGFESRPCRHQWQGSSEVEHVKISSPLVDCPALRRAV